MSFLELKLPPGVYRQGTAQESKGRFYDANLVRWVDGWLRPIRGWRLRPSDSTGLIGAPRAVLAWRTNDAKRWVAVGTHSNLYVQSAGGVVSDITPTPGFTAGGADAVVQTGYGDLSYGAYAYGTPRPDTGTPKPATVWTLDTWGEDLVGCSDGDGTLYQWVASGADPAATPAAPIANAPTGCQGLVVSDERFLFALAPGGNPRKVAWSDQEDNTYWTSDPAHQAGDFELNTSGQLVAARAMQGRTLFLTTLDAWIASYIGFPLVYGFQRVGSGCGLIAKQALAVIDDGQVAWMSPDGFFLYNGYVQPIPCDVADFVFSGMNAVQASKVSAAHLSAFGEVWWFYPSATSIENDRYVAWSYRTATWTVGALSRLCAVDKGVFAYPIMIDATGLIYEHEVGFDYGGATPYATTGPIELGAGDAMMEVQGLIPDDKTLGDVTASFTARMWPDDSSVSYGPYTLTSPTDVLFQGREVTVTFTGATFPGASPSDWRVGAPKLDIVGGDPR